MVTCVILIDSMDVINVTLLRDNKILSNYIGDLPISHFINDKIDKLKVVFKPTLCNSVPEDAYKIGNVRVNGVNKSCVISFDDFNNLSSLIGKVEDIEIFNYIDLYKDLYKEKDSVVVVDAWSKNLASIVYIQFGEIVDFRRVNYNNLPSILGKFTTKYNCHTVVNGRKSFDFIGLHSNIENLNLIDKERLQFLKHLSFCMDSNGMSIRENNEILNWNEDDNTNIRDLESEYYSRNIKEDSFNLDSSTDIEDSSDSNDYGCIGSDCGNDSSSSHSNYGNDSDNNCGDYSNKSSSDKVGFFARLFGKKNKPSKKKSSMDGYSELEDDSVEAKSRKSTKPNRGDNNKPKGDSKFSAPGDYDEFEFGDNEEDSSFSQLAVGDYKSSRKPNGFNPNGRKCNTLDYAFYVGFTTFLAIAFIFGGLQFIYKEKVGILSDTYESAVKMKNNMESSVEIADNPAASPVVKISQINHLSLPSSYKIENVEYSGNEYRVTVKVSVDDNIDSFSNFLPEGLSLAKINPKEASDSNKIYDIILVAS